MVADKDCKFRILRAICRLIKWALLDREPDPTREQIKEALSGVLCRCTGYQQIFESVEEALVRMGRRKPKEVAS